MRSGSAAPRAVATVSIVLVLLGCGDSDGDGMGANPGAGANAGQAGGSSMVVTYADLYEVNRAIAESRCLCDPADFAACDAVVTDRVLSPCVESVWNRHMQDLADDLRCEHEQRQMQLECLQQTPCTPEVSVRCQEQSLSCRPLESILDMIMREIAMECPGESP